EEFVLRGHSTLLDGLRERFPPGTAELSRVLSLAQVRRLHEALGISSIAELRRACEQNKVRWISGFGAKSELKLLERIDSDAPPRALVILPQAAAQGLALREHLLRSPAVVRAELAGAFRRREETIAELELVVGSDRAQSVAAQAKSASIVGSVESKKGSDRFVVHQLGLLDAHVRVVPPSDFAAAWIRATGSAAHVAKLAALAKKKRLVFDERGLRGARGPIPIASEEELYARLGLAFVPPELREDSGEIEAAARDELPPDLVRVEDLQGAVHCHTVHSDGKNTVLEMARAAEALGLKYLTITDHSASATYAHGVELERLERLSDEIASVQEQVDIKLLHGTESDILRDGALDYPPKVLRRLDVVIASVHQRYKLDSESMTKRLVRALSHPLFKIWGHALGRYVLSRPPFECDMDEVLDTVAKSRAAVEINGDPNRLDLAPRWIREASKRGIRFVVSSDAHSTQGLRNASWGVDMARRGWLRKQDVLNTLGAEEFAAAVKP
ncbi:MAG TPA: PHP domain-containing protein, partial [Planctomycetota bacterium]|nr:PHP domain-containing protein [Planctomycetota bacterium]